MDRAADSLWARFLVLKNLVVREMQGDLAATAALNLSVPQSIALFQIAEAGAITISDLQGRLARSQAATSHIVTQLERRGLVDRGTDPDDQRRTVVRLSRGGRTLLEQIQKIRRRSFDKLVRRLPPAVAAQLDAALQATLTALEEEKRP